MHSILLVLPHNAIIGASVSEPHLGSSTRPLSVCLSVCLYIYIYIIRPSFLVPRTPRYASEPHLGSSTRPLSVCLSVCLYIYIYIYISYVCHFWSRGSRATRASPTLGVQRARCLSVCQSVYRSYVRHFWSRGPRATRKRKPAHLKFKGHMHACCILLYVANASRAITTLIERLHMYSSSLITSSAG